MGIFGAMITAVSGLRAQSFALENISGNIANSRTTGFKRIDTSFQDLITGDGGARGYKAQTAGNVLANSRPTNTLQGALEASDDGTHIAVSGDGYFVVAEQTNEVDNKPVFGDLAVYTRRGDFALDKNGNFVNGSGYFLQGLPLNPQTGNPSGSIPELIQVSNDFLAAVGTTQIEYRANLPTHPVTSDTSSELLVSTLIGNDVTGTDESSFFDSSVAGQAVTTYNENGSPVTVEFRWAKTQETPTATWSLYYLTDSTATGTDIKWTRVPQDFEFDTAGTLTKPTGTNILISALTVNGTLIGDVDLEFGTTGLTQFDNPNGVINVTELSQNGSATGEQETVAIASNGRVVLTYTNGRKIEVAEIVLVEFNADNALLRMEGGAYAETDESGPPILGASGSVVGQALEASNSDIAEEFSNLIVTQKAYSANAKIIISADEMLTEALNIIR